MRKDFRLLLTRVGPSGMLESTDRGTTAKEMIMENFQDETTTTTSTELEALAESIMALDPSDFQDGVILESVRHTDLLSELGLK